VSGGFRYRTYGLIIQSSFRLPELAPAAEEFEVDVEIAGATLADHLPAAEIRTNWLELSGSAALLKVKGIANYLTTDGRLILVDISPEMTQDGDELTPDVRLYLLGMALMTAVYQRGGVPFHMSSIAMPGGTCAFSGDSGDGKSTIAAWLYQRMHFPVLSDDVSLLQVVGNTIRPLPGPRKLKLWKDSLAAIKIDYQNIKKDMLDEEKYQVYLGDEAEENNSLSLRCLFLLERCAPNQSPVIRQLQGAEAFQGVMSSVHRPALADFYLPRETLMKHVMNVAERIEVVLYRRPWDLSELDSTMRHLLDFLESSSRSAASGSGCEIKGEI